MFLHNLLWRFLKSWKLGSNYGIRSIDNWRIEGYDFKFKEVNMIVYSNEIFPLGYKVFWRSNVKGILNFAHSQSPWKLTKTCHISQISVDNYDTLYMLC